MPPTLALYANINDLLLLYINVLSVFEGDLSYIALAAAQQHCKSYDLLLFVINTPFIIIHAEWWDAYQKLYF